MQIEMGRLIKRNREKVLKLMQNLNLDAVLVTSLDNVRYITGERPFMMLDWYVDAFPAIFTSSGHIESLTTYYGTGLGWKSFPFIPAPLVSDRWADHFASIFKKLNLSSGNIGIDYLYFETLEKLKRHLPKATFHPILDQLLKIRAVKTEYEIEMEREAAKIIDLGLEAGYDSLAVGVTENEVFAKMLKVMTEAGSEGPPFFSLCCSGERTLHSLLSSNRKLKDGDFVWFDIGCVFNGYIGDGARTGLVGRAGKEHKELYATIYEAHMRGIRATKPGVRASEIDRAIREYLREVKYPDYPHSSGHGIGLRTVELPWITSSQEAGSQDMILEPGMIFALEPKTYKEGFAAAGLEDMVLVTESGCEVLTKAHYLEELL
jgi:Xaa-Pro aminopeptidase